MNKKSSLSAADVDLRRRLGAYLNAQNMSGKEFSKRMGRSATWGGLFLSGKIQGTKTVIARIEELIAPPPVAPVARVSAFNGDTTAAPLSTGQISKELRDVAAALGVSNRSTLIVAAERLDAYQQIVARATVVLAQPLIHGPQDDD